MTIPADPGPDDIADLKAALATERAARLKAEAELTLAQARIAGAEALITQLKLAIARHRRDRYGQSSERGRKILDQLELALEELEATATEDAVAVERAAARAGGPPLGRSVFHRRPRRATLPAHLPRERVVVPGPTACPCCGGRLVKIGEDITESLEVIPRQWKVIQTVREKFSCRSCETISQPPAPFHAIARGRAGPSLLAMILYAKFGQHLPLNRQSDIYAREGIELDTSTLADWVGACTATLAPLFELIRGHVLAAERVRPSFPSARLNVMSSRSRLLSESLPAFLEAVRILANLIGAQAAKKRVRRLHPQRHPLWAVASRYVAFEDLLVDANLL